MARPRGFEPLTFASGGQVMKNIGDLKIIAERERSGMVSVWNEYLCLRQERRAS